MKPRNIILVRHGESEGNVDKTLYQDKPDYAMELTIKGKEQAISAGKLIKKYLEEDDIYFNLHNKIQFYVSPFFRTRQTYEGIVKSFPNFKFYEDPRLREQEWSGSLRKDFRPDTENERDRYGHFYYRLPNGESCADVYDRISDLLNTLHRDFERKDFPENVIIVTHGMSLRVFLMRWFHLSVEDFELLANPKNCEFHILRRQSDEKYELITNPRKYTSRNHPYQYKWKSIDKQKSLV